MEERKKLGEETEERRKKEVITKIILTTVSKNVTRAWKTLHTSSKYDDLPHMLACHTIFFFFI